MKRIGIFGGTFDPFTIAHKAIVEKVLDEKLVDEIIILPSVVQYYRCGKTTWLKDTEKYTVIYQMLKSRAANFKYANKVHIDMYEYEHFAISDTAINNRRYVHSLADIIQRYGINNEYYTIIGTDSLCNFHTWWNYETILSMSKLIAVDGREGSVLPEETYGAKIISIDPKYSTISATAIRTKYKNLEDYINSEI